MRNLAPNLSSRCRLAPGRHGRRVAVLFRSAVLGALLLAVATPSASAASPPVEQRVEELLSRMTLVEKVQLMYGTGRPRGVHSVGYVPGVPRLGIPPTHFSDGPVGVKDSCFSEIYPDNCRLGESTALPATVSLAASFDRDLARAYGRLAGAEARARGVDVLLAPAMNIVRVPQGGRSFEYFGEDPYVTGRLASAYVRGLQSQDVGAQIKHFALNNQELDRHTTTSNADERTMREIYLPGWHAAVTEGDAYSLMCANNMVNGTYNCEHPHLLGEVLKGEWGFQGVVGTDYCATRSALGSVNAGLDQSFTGCQGDWGRWYRDLPDLVRQGQVSEPRIDLHVRRILTMMFRLGMFGERSPARPVDVTANGAFSRKVAERGSVLLKNDRNLLPLDASSLDSIAVIGEYADTALTGGGGSSRVIPYYAVSPVEGIRDRVGDDVAVTTADGSDLGGAAALARESDVAVVIVNDSSREGQDRPNIDLPGNQNQLVEAVQAANPRTIVVLKTGSAITMPWISDVHAVLEMWYPGQEDGNALAALLFGDVNPSGRLPVTFPVSLEQSCCHVPPRYPHADGVYAYSEGLEVGYRWYDAQERRPLFPFGYGISYTTFAYSDLRVTPKVVDPSGEVGVSLRVTNTGDRTGTATPQVYLGFPPEVGEPPRRLVAFERVRLRPGEARRVTMSLSREAFSYWSSSAHNWDVAAGTYTVWAGSSSRDLPLRDEFTVQHADGVQGIGVQAPDRIASGSSADVTVTVTNTGGEVLPHPEFDLRAPTGWVVTATSRPPAVVPPHGEASVTYRVRAPGNAGPALYVLTARARWQGLAAGSATRAVSLHAAP